MTVSTYALTPAGGKKKYPSSNELIECETPKFLNLKKPSEPNEAWVSNKSCASRLLLES